MSEAIQVGGISDWAKGWIVTILEKQIGVSIADLKAALTAGNLDKVGDLLRKLAEFAGYPAEGAALDELLNAIAKRDPADILDELGDSCKVAAKLIRGESAPTPTPKLLTAGPVKVATTAEVVGLLESLEAAPVMASASPTSGFVAFDTVADLKSGLSSLPELTPDDVAKWVGIISEILISLARWYLTAKGSQPAIATA